ncbi:MAG: tectonin domain-containing protein, partial [Acidobacteriota bacterium]
MTAISQPRAYAPLSGKATDVGVGADGTMWMLGTDAGPGGFNIYRRSGGNWQQIPGSATRIAVDPKGAAWVVNNTGNIFRWNGTAFDTMSGSAIDVGIGADGTVWILGTDDAAKRWTGSAWTSIGGGAKSIAVGPDGNPWVVNGAGDIWRHDGKAWIALSGHAADIAVDAAGSVFVVGGPAAPGGLTVQQLAGTTWTADGSVGGVRIAAGPKGMVIVAQDAAAGSALQARLQEGTVLALPPPSLMVVAPPSPSPVPAPAPPPPTPILIQGTISMTVPLNINPAVTPNVPAGGGSVTSGSLVVGSSVPGVPTGSAPLIVSGQYKTQVIPGSLACSDGGDVNSTRCGLVPATDLGTFTPKAPGDCPSGSFYDSFFGGSCWTCGDWDRTAKPIDTEEACSGKVYVKAISRGNAAVAWNCPSDAFWDGWNGGTCWKCPDGYARSVSPINGDWGCFRQADKVAEFKKNLGCSQQTEWSLGKPKPFPDLGLNKCFACPTLDENTGEVLITQRSINAADSAQACRIQFRWKPAGVKTLRVASSEGPGVLPGAAEIVGDILRDPGQISDFFRYRATEEGVQPAALNAFLERHWAELAANPNENETIKAMLFERVLRALDKPKDQRTAAEQRLLEAFREQTQARQVSVAQDALDMYHSWKASVEQARARRASNVGDLLYYGTVPPDFDVAAQTGAVLGTVGLGGVAFTSSYATYVANLSTRAVFQGGQKLYNSLNGFSKATQAVRAMIRAGSMADDVAQGARALVTGARAAITGFSAAAAGATVILIVGGILADIAIEQFVDIVTAEDKLNGKLTAAQTPVVLEDISNRANGAAQLAYLWAGMLDTATGQADSRLVPLAQAAAAAARASGYAG